MFQDFKHGSSSIGDLYLCAMESKDKPRGSDGFWYIEKAYKICKKYVGAYSVIKLIFTDLADF